MKLRCPACATSYDLRPGALAPGRKVRCARCGETWLPEAVEGEIEEPTGRDLVAVARSPASPPERPVLDQAIGFPPLEPVPGRRARRAPGRPRQARTAGLRLPAAAAAFAALAILGAAVGLRHPIVAGAPDLAGLYRAVGLPVNLRGLEFRNLAVTREDDGGRPVLLVSGEIENVAGTEVEVPAIRLALRAEARQEIYAWSVEPDATRLAAGASLPFRARIDTPPPDAREVVARFTDRRRVASAEGG